MTRLAVPVAAAALVLTLAAPGAARGETTIADERAPTSVSAHAGRIVWSSFDPVRGEHRLMTQAGTGAPERVPVPPSPTPFEADLGPGPRGGTVAVYARCEPECDVVMFDFASGRERPVRGASSARSSEFAPTVWRDRVAFARVRRAQQRVPRLRLVSLSRPRRARALPGGSRTCVRARIPCRRIRVSDLQLASRRLAFVWVQDAGDIQRIELLSGRVGRAPRVVARSGHGVLSSSDLFGPSYSGRYLYFGFSRTGSGPSTSRFVRARLGTGALDDADAPYQLTGTARDGTRTYYAVQDGEFDCGAAAPGPPGCHVRLADPPGFRPYRRTRFGPGYGPPR